ncbi:autotransporter outer membrane beta-barrel domain-containing protein [Acuticoccus sp. I52.16.1]|uniref:autotransporter outer membrane beta-barrel domain-containing protein n=1 Tax=Acuticoccus sp. I52.16.1 TaxID=2928472 RepID=UPI001FD0EEAD|nr:autotransporter outer membrane beta-barrel domain-containing protein [Acuticoccus sp. I52.16.1]UOM33389.1 autotransporter outer membrane beta-barrel domain-containing protein [Acuticoccus sp. I52.16.1]
MTKIALRCGGFTIGACALNALFAAVPAAAGCQLVPISIDTVRVDCTGSFDNYTQNSPPADVTSYQFDSLTKTIEGKPSSTPVYGVFENPSVAIINPKSSLAASLYLYFAGGSYGTDAMGHSLGLVNRGRDGADGEPGNKGEAGGAGERSGGVTVGVSSGPIRSTFAIDDATEGTAIRAAVIAESRGGDGGDGGDGTYSSFSQSHGGAGGAGATGNGVSMELSSGVSVASKNGLGVSVQSIGGDGGDGGDASSGLAASTGGNGGKGGHGGSISVRSDAAITASEIGISARSLGGAGGQGGEGSGVGRANGGSGAGSGDGGGINVTLGGSIATGEDGGMGVAAQSIGGFAGAGGNGGGFVGYGASSESAGRGGRVRFTMKDGTTVTTEGTDAGGVVLESTGGGGGIGGKGAGLGGLGAEGAAGGDGGEVIATLNGGAITTKGDNAAALIAASAGDGGGIAGESRGVVALGGSGGLGGDGGKVTVTNEATLTTSGLESDAINATSVGGGGGLALTTGALAAFGGDGGKGGNGDAVTVANAGAIETSGDNSTGILMQSIGGGGGNGSSSFSTAPGLSIAYGGNGGEGGHGGDVTYGDVDGKGGGSILTTGDQSDGIFAQSAGEGGGSGGAAVAATGGLPLSMAIGASGGGSTGGNGGKVVLETSTDIETRGDQAAGIVAQSQGGGGGDSGAIIDPALSPYSVSVSIGGSAGPGGNGGTSRVDATGDITTLGDLSDGIFAQSVGGGGGSALASSGGSLGAGKFAGFGLSLGVSGGKGGTGGAVSVISAGDIATKGDGSRAIFAQSIGGGGGNGSNAATFSVASAASVNIAIGGNGGKGGTSSAVTVNASGNLSTEGQLANALLAQSVGGGGGAGGNATRRGAFNVLDIDLGFGGTGGSGNKGAAVTTTTTGSILTKGDLSNGIVAQSVGGGGGIGGNATAVGGIEFFNAGVSMGGKGGTGSHGSTVNVDQDGNVTTEGVGSAAIIAQSIGAGGGVGGVAGNLIIAPQINLRLGGSAGAAGDGGAIDADLGKGGSLTTFGDASPGLLAQSVGGGGGLVSLGLEDGSIEDLDIILGGNGAAGNGGVVEIDNANTIHTEGDESHAILAQSIGGGGGVVFLDQGGIDSNIGIGGTGSRSGNGANVTLVNTAKITTAGDEAAGIIAQSIGGGGGLGANAMLAFGGTADALNLGAAVGGRQNGFAPIVNGGASESGFVRVTSKGDITTTGKAAHGIIAQSVAGSGGIGVVVDDNGETIATMAGTAGGAAGDAGNVSVRVSGNVDVSGEEAHGIIAQSAGSSKGRNTLVNVTGSVTATGKNGRGILAQSGGGSRDGNLTIEVGANGRVTAGAKARAAILMLQDTGGRDDAMVIDNAGIIEKRGSFEDGSDENYAIQVGSGKLTVNNTGLISGNIYGGVTGSIPNGVTVNNKLGAVLELGRETYLGAGKISGGGTITAGERGVIRESTVYGSGGISQGLDGTLHFDHQLGDGIAAEATADKIDIKGVARFNGRVTTEIVGTNLVETGDTGEVEVLQLSKNGSNKVEVQVEDTATVDYRLVEEANDLGTLYSLAYTVDYTPWQDHGIAGTQSASTARNGIDEDDNLGNATRFGFYLDSLVDERLKERAAIATGTLDPSASKYEWVEDMMAYILDIPDVGSLLTNYELMIPNVHSAPLDATLLSGIDFADALLSCSGGTLGEGVATMADEVSCAWARMQANDLHRGATSTTLGYDETSFGISVGLQAEIAEGLSAGMGLSYETASLDADYLRDGSGDRLQAGVLLEKRWDGLTIGAGLTGGFGAYAVDRLTRTPTGLASAKSDSTIGFLSAHLRIARAFDFDAFTLTPKFDAGLHHQWRPGFTETGAGVYGVRIDDYEETAFTLSPEIEIGSEIGFAGIDAHVFARAGVLGLIADDRVMQATFTGVADDGPTLSVKDDPDRIFGKLAVGIDAAINQDWSVKVVGKSLIGADQQAYSGSARLEFRF